MCSKLWDSISAYQHNSENIKFNTGVDPDAANTAAPVKGAPHWQNGEYKVSYKILNEEVYQVEGALLCGHMFYEFAPSVEEKYWTDFQDIFSKKKFKGRHGEITICANWEEMIAYCLQRKYERKSDLRIKATGLSARKYSKGQRRSIYAEYVELFLNYIFLAVNISAPGGFELYGAKLHRNDYLAIHEFKMCAEYYIFYKQILKVNNWPIIEIISLKEVNNWLQAVDIGTKQMSTNRTEKALFSFLHLAYVNDYLVDSVLWLSYALEGLYDTPFAAIKKMLTDRICLVLGSPSNEQKKAIGQFYDIRSSLFHGRMEIHHPMNNELLDPSVDKNWVDLPDHIATATVIVIATIQRLVLTKSRYFTFTETFSADRI